MQLANLQTDQGFYALLGIDQIEDLALLFGLDWQDRQTAYQLEALIEIIFSNLATSASAVIFDPRHYLSILTRDERLAAATNCLFRLQLQPAGKLDLLQILPDWGVEFVRNNYGVAQLTFYYHPQEKMALEKKKFLAEIFDFCHFEGVDLAVDLRIISPDGQKVHPDVLPEIQLAALQELRRLADLWILQYPGNSLAAATITAELDNDWLLTPDGEKSYQKFKENLRDSLDNGAKGFVARQLLWSEAGNLRNQDQTISFDRLDNFFQTTIRDRMIELRRIVDEAADRQDETAE